jgi:hypothetical protein
MAPVKPPATGIGVAMDREREGYLFSLSVSRSNILLNPKIERAAHRTNFLGAEQAEASIWRVAPFLRTGLIPAASGNPAASRKRQSSQILVA